MADISRATLSLSKLRPTQQSRHVHDASYFYDVDGYTAGHLMWREVVEHLTTMSSHSAIEKGATFITEGQPATYVYKVMSGTAKVYTSLHDGRQQITGFTKHGDFLGLATSERFAFSAEALDPMEICSVPCSQFKSLLNEYPALRLRLLDRTLQELAAANDHLLLLGRKTADERLATFLLALAAEHHQTAGAQPVRAIRFAMSRRDIADYLGLTIETISRIFGRFKRKKLIATSSSSEFTIIDRKALAEIAEGFSEERPSASDSSKHGYYVAGALTFLALLVSSNLLLDQTMFLF